MILDLGERLRSARMKKGLSQTQAAARLNLSKTSVSSYENNVKTPSLEVLIQLALFYHVSADFLLGLDSRPVLTLEGLTAGQQDAVCRLVEEMRQGELLISR